MQNPWRLYFKDKPQVRLWVYIVCLSVHLYASIKKVEGEKISAISETHTCQGFEGRDLHIYTSSNSNISYSY